jgi:aminocarboxymuconate-semialdehyde decarboxylase
MIIDANSHGLHGKYLDQLGIAGGDWARKILENLAGLMQIKPSMGDVNLRLELLDKYDIGLQVVTPFPGIDSNFLPGDTNAQLALARAINDNMARLMDDSKGKLLAAGSIPLVGFEQGGRQEMERAIKTLGLKAICIPTNLMGKPSDLPEFESFWSLAAELNIPVYIHPCDPAGRTDRSYEAEYGLTHSIGWPYETALALSRLVFSGIMERNPSLKVANHHLGGGMIPFFFPGRISEIYNPSQQERIIGQVLPRPIFDYFSRFYYDTAVGRNPTAIKCTYDVFGVEQLIYATDFPFGSGSGEGRLAEYPEVIKSTGLSETENKKIFGDNARKMLNIA